MAIKVLDPAMNKIVAPDATVERLATGFMFTEGPIWMPDGSLHFSDMPADVRRRWHPDNGASVIRRPANKCNGMTRDAAGNLYVCEHVTSRVVMEAPDGSTKVVASHYQGKELNSPNDVIVASDGSIIFTDPEWGRTIGAVGLERPRELPITGIYRSKGPGSELQLLVGDFVGPNGLCLSPDEKRLYVNDTMKAHVRVFDVGKDFKLTNDRVFADKIGTPMGDAGSEAGVVDGMKVDSEGNVYVTGPHGVWVYDPNGRQLGLIEVPEVVANLNWGGSGWNELYLTASGSLYRIVLKASGNRLAYM